MLNINSQFAGKRAVTAPVVKVPRSVKEALCIDAAHKNGIFKIEPGDGTVVYDQCYIFEDINYKTQDGDKKDSTLLEIMKWFKAMDSQFKITIANEQSDMAEYISGIFVPVHGEDYPAIEKGIGAWINQKIDEGTRDIRQVLYLTVTCRAKSFAEASVFFGTLDTVLHGVFAALKSRLYRMSGEERLAVLQRMLRLGRAGIPPRGISPGDDSWKNQVLPVSIGQYSDYLMVDGRYACVLFAHDYAQTLHEEKVVHSLSDMLFPTLITLDIEPVRKRLLKDKLRNAHANNERAITQEQERDGQNGRFRSRPSYNLDRKQKELEGMMDLVDDNDEEAVFLGFLVLVYADTLDELDQRVDTLQQKAALNEYTLEPYYHQQLKAFNTILPIGGRQVDHMRSLLTSSAVAFQPFYARDLKESGAYVYGMNITTKHLLLGNRKKLPAPHGMLCGHSGSGKSFLIKETEIAQTLLFTDDDVIVLDPNNEQEESFKNFKGQYFNFTPQGGIYMNPFETPEDVWKGDSVAKQLFIAKKVQFATAFCSAVMKNMAVTQLHLNSIDRAVRQMYEAYFGQGRRDRQPTLILLRQILREQAEKEDVAEVKLRVRDIADSLEQYTEGVYDMFARPSNLDLSGRLVGFGLKNIPKNVWEPVMVAVMHFLTMRIEYNQAGLIAARLVVDEAQVMCEEPASAAQLLYAVETYRKVGAVVTLAVQNLTRVLENPELRDMFSNCPYKCFLDQGGVDAASLAQIQELSGEEYSALSNSAPGCGVMVWGSQVYLFDAGMAKENVLYPLFNTDFHEKAAEGKQQQAAGSQAAGQPGGGSPWR